MTHTPSRNSTSGFTLIELVIVLGITGLIFSGLWGLLTSGSTALQAQSAAQQYRQVIEATRKYATSGVYDGQGAGLAAAQPTIATYTGAGVNLLPSTFATTDAYGNAISILVEIIDASKQQFRFVVFAGPRGGAPTVAVPDKVGAQISSLIGSEGGFVYGNATDGCSTAGTATSTACGSFNSFALTVTSAPFTITAGRGRVVAMGYTIDTNAGTAPWLYRKAGVTAEQNTMQQNMLFNSGLTLSMQGSNIISGTGKIIMGGGSISMGADAASTGGGILYMGNAGIRNVTQLNQSPAAGQPNLGIFGNNIGLTSATSIDVVSGSTFNVSTTSGSAATLAIVGRGTADTFEAGKFIYSSDINMKENIRPIMNALERVLMLRGMNYDWKGSHTHDVGLLAQDVQKAFPELVTKISDTRMGVDYPRMIAPIVEAIRQLKMENDALKEKVQMLEKQKNQ